MQLFSKPLCALTFSLSLLITSENHLLQLHAQQSYAETINSVQPKIVKLYGAGGARGLESYQSGFLISSEGHVLTVWSYVLDTEQLTVVLDDGRRFTAELIGADPRLAIALLKIPAAEVPHFQLANATPLTSGNRVLAFCNLFGVATGNESASVLHGNVAVRTQLTARRGAFESTYKGSVYVLDAMTNNPGAAGGALTDRQGNLAGLLGKELRNSLDNTWLNYAIPIEELVGSIDDLMAGRVPTARRTDDSRLKPNEPMSLDELGVALVPNLLTTTPPFVDQVRNGFAAHAAGLRTDDLILFVNDRLVASCKDLRNELEYIDRIDELVLMIERDKKDLLEIKIRLP